VIENCFDDGAFVFIRLYFRLQPTLIYQQM